MGDEVAKKMLIEQVVGNGEIVLDFDSPLSTKEIKNKLIYCFPNLYQCEEEGKFFAGEYKGVEYAIRCKNVTYLGNPHPVNKKRIQISGDLVDFYNFACDHNYVPLLLGIYNYKDNLLFVDFGIDTYVKKKAHNSSAHVYTEDLAVASEEGYFEKTDAFGNHIIIVRHDCVELLLEEKLKGELLSTVGTDICENMFTHTVNNSVVIGILEDFAKTIDKKWYGISCYAEMICASYRNKYQAEWPGFYLEYLFENYLEEEDLEDEVCFKQDKTDTGIDLDLFFPKLGIHGDLKTHSTISKGVPGNDWDTIMKELSDNGHVYYVVAEHETEKDSLYDFKVTKFWNEARDKKDLMSYSAKMKNNVTLKRIVLLDINNENKQYLSVFRQGINSDGKPRSPKILIDSDKMEYFAIHEINL